MPTIPFPAPLPPSLRNDTSTLRLSQASTPTPSQQSSKENDAPPNDITTPKATTPSQTTPPPPSQSFVPDTLPRLTPPLGTLPPQLLALQTSLTKILKIAFYTSPPYTVQRLAELILRPTSHYRTLPSYLRALDRVLSVSSSISDFPLPSLGMEENSNASYLAVGAPAVGQEEFNGAALTRIPWLRDAQTGSMLLNSDRPLQGDLRTESTSVIDGPNGAGSLETVTVSVNGMGRGQDPLNSYAGPTHDLILDTDEPAHSGRVTRSSTAQARKEEEDEERVHARGPEEVGMEDTGPQVPGRGKGGFDAEAAVGRVGEGEETGAEVVGVTRAKETEEEVDEEGMDMEEAGKGEDANDEGNDENGQQTLVDTSAL
ncbi:hypothetical protein MMC30_003170 [Trapelia coarctata]|nr:hypothetical protein [Trapelia coarctata]